MNRARISTTVDEDLLKTARRLRRGASDSVLVEEALAALVALNRSAEIDASYVAYDREPLTSEDQWGDLAAFREAAARS
ncbi:MAG: type II toxin-antitoxin system VapB family antitoxin [Actinomycetota bacterium]|nr:type II toxin-antitoxin system VapB family antitoxin [Actinomycetota bacterium]